jgi:hypothetical protein
MQGFHPLVKMEFKGFQRRFSVNSGTSNDTDFACFLLLPFTTWADVLCWIIQTREYTNSSRKARVCTVYPTQYVRECCKWACETSSWEHSYSSTI